MYVSIGVFTYRSMHPTIDAVTGRETDRLDSRDVIRLHALLALGSLVRDLGTLIEALEAVAGYTRVVHEEIITALVGGDEAVALLVGKPLYCSLGHIWSPPFVFLGLHCNKNAAPLVEGGSSFTIKPTSSTAFLLYHEQGRSPKAPTLEDGTSVLLVFGLLKPRKSFSERHILLDGAPGTPLKLLRPFYELYKSLGLDSFRF